ncbi:uncharacterized protein K489DRAFT_38729 [Dissoconium aciculare CBS 342.82]|uniref:Uncharacterized protein n=1 Tax=Dissoconium aciculare CBS 342.82 TaxID=1314786 RepID=A0A6J3LY15_9PEZI|nr:uncharacterized protein K489DRAFT_38729 [Dissoconium aciculare CBS 342.82]KAF1820636.1 hypothetical protein K489DRAFT_38729 [Dissoconium aciculare CBS 342.82]
MFGKRFIYCLSIIDYGISPHEGITGFILCVCVVYFLECGFCYCWHSRRTSMSWRRGKRGLPMKMTTRWRYRKHEQD